MSASFRKRLQGFNSRRLHHFRFAEEVASGLRPSALVSAKKFQGVLNSAKRIPAESRRFEPMETRKSLISNIRNRGIVGDDTAGIIARLDEITKSQPAQVFLMVGINDLAIRTPQEKIITNIVEIVEKIHTDSPETEVFVQSVLPNRKQLHKQIESLNIKLEKEIAGKATWVNLYPLFLYEEKASMNNSLSNDDAHLLGQGYLIWRDAITDFVNKSE